jgi:predicted TIM-barrel enzyme
MFYSRDLILDRLSNKIKQNETVLMFGAGNGFNALNAEKGGADLIAVYSTAILRMQGLPSAICTLPYYDANGITIETLKTVSPLITEKPLIMGIGAHNPSVDINHLLDWAIDNGISGIVNEPFAGNYGEFFSNYLEKIGLGFAKEIELIEKARKKGLLTVAWAMNPVQAEKMADAGADIIGAMVLYLDRDFVGKKEEDYWDIGISKINKICEKVKAKNKEVIVLTHGDPYYDVETARQSILQTSADGYASGSSGEKTPAEKAVVDTVKSYLKIKKCK